MNVYTKLASVQAELNAPKNRMNKFGGYAYRSCEDILEALKPLLKRHGLALVLHDDVKVIGERYYIRAEAVLADIEDGSVITTEAFAREEESKKGMDGAQITGTASSYARKYALNGLFAIDDNKDPDTNEYTEVTKSNPAEQQKKNLENLHNSFPGLFEPKTEPAAVKRICCEKCGAAIEPYTSNKDGSIISPEDHAALSMKFSGKVLCQNHLKEYRTATLKK